MYRDFLATQKGKPPSTPAQPEPETEIGTYQDLLKEMDRRFETISRKTLDQARYEASLQEELRTVRGTLLQVATDAKISQEELAKIVVEVEQDYGWDQNQLGSATKLARAVVKELQLREALQRMTGRVTKAEAEAAARVKTAALVAQPAAGALPSTTTKTEEEKLLEDMNKLVPKSAFGSFEHK